MRARLCLAALALAAGAATPAFGADRTLSASETVIVEGSGPLVWDRVSARASPSLHARVVATFGQFLPDYRPRQLLALGALRDADGRPVWYQVEVPGRPNGRTAWVPAASVAVAPVDRWLVIFRGARRFAFVRAGRVVRSGRVAVGAAGMPTPVGLYYVQEGFVPTDDPVLGAYAFATSAYSSLSEWPGGGIVGVHGTNTPQLIGQAVSHGCVRLLNRDIDYLRRAMPAGTPIKIVP